MWVSIIIYGFLSGGMAALSLSTTVELAGQSQAATATGLFLVVGYLGALFGPWLVGLLASTTGSFIMSTSACVLLTGVIVILGLSLKETGKRPISGRRSKDGTTRATD
jgi:cyanate permease